MKRTHLALLFKAHPNTKEMEPYQISNFQVKRTHFALLFKTHPKTKEMEPYQISSALSSLVFFQKSQTYN